MVSWDWFLSSCMFTGHRLGAIFTWVVLQVSDGTLSIVVEEILGDKQLRGRCAAARP
jgi:hypothetical protein